jgi:predicted esterase YcpF (UPF0227 family)
MRDIFFIHGFMSGKDSSKWEFLCKEYADNLDKIHIIEVDYKKTDPYTILEMYRDKVRQLEDPIVIGHSLGGFFAKLLSDRCSTIIINPCFEPLERLTIDPDRSLPVEFHEAYGELSKQVWKDRHLCVDDCEGEYGSVYLIEEGDENINQTAYLDKYKRNGHLISWKDGNHSFQHYDQLRQEIQCFQDSELM